MENIGKRTAIRMDGLGKDDGIESKLGKLEEEFEVVGVIFWAVGEKYGGGAICWVKTRVAVLVGVVEKGCMLAWYVGEVHVFLLWGGNI